jgi:hypothetical protein
LTFFRFMDQCYKFPTFGIRQNEARVDKVVI